MEIKRELYFDEENKKCKIRYYVPTKNFLSFTLPANEKAVDWFYDTKTEEYIIYCEENSSNNFLSEIRALTKKNEKLPFSERYPYIANEIYEAARQGYHSCFYMLDNNEINGLRAEGFTVEDDNYFNLPQISW